MKEKLRDARIFQILFLGLLLAAGAFLRDFSVKPAQVILTFLAGLSTQAFFKKFLRLQNVNYLSVAITCLSLSLLLRADNFWGHPLAACLAIASKFLIRLRGKHIYNPGCLGAVLGLLFLPGAWVSPGQWGYDFVLAGWIFILGTFVVRRAQRSDVSWSFLAFYLGMIALRIIWLGQRWPVFFHAMQNGSLLLFAFFMISDPMTIPNHSRGRVVYAGLVATIAFTWQFVFYKTNALLWSLFLASPLVIIFDFLWPALKFEWRKSEETGGSDHETKQGSTPLDVLGRSGGGGLTEPAA